MQPTPPLSRTTVVLHWLIAAAIIGMLGFGLWIGASERGPGKTALIQIHKSCGLIVALLVVVRIAWRVWEGFPRPVAGIAPLEQRMSRAVHLAMLAIILMMPLTGIMKSITYGRPINVFGVPVIPQLLAEKNEALNELFTSWHAGLGYTLIVLIGLHVAASLKHHFVNKDWRG